MTVVNETCSGLRPQISFYYHIIFPASQSSVCSETLEATDPQGSYSRLLLVVYEIFSKLIKK